MSALRVALVALDHLGGSRRLRLSAGQLDERPYDGRCLDPGPSGVALAAETHLIEKPAARARVASHEATAWVRQSALATQIHAWHPDIVPRVRRGLSHSARAAAALAAQGVAVAATWHDPKSHGQLFDRVQHAVAARTMRSAAGVHVHCEALAPERVAAKLLVAELPAFPCPSCPGLTTTQPLRAEGTIAMVGRFAPYKGVDEMCDAVTEYWRSGGLRRFVVVGQGRVPSSLRRLHEQWPSLVSIENAYVSGERLHDVLSDAAICVMPYLSGTQSALPWLPRAHGAHLIASDVGCIGEAGRRIGARIVTPGSTTQLVEALLERPSSWTDVGRMPMPTFAALAERLLEWYPSLSAS